MTHPAQKSIVNIVQTNWDGQLASDYVQNRLNGTHCVCIIVYTGLTHSIRRMIGFETFPRCARLCFSNYAKCGRALRKIILSSTTLLPLEWSTIRQLRNKFFILQFFELAVLKRKCYSNAYFYWMFITHTHNFGASAIDGQKSCVCVKINIWSNAWNSFYDEFKTF